MAALADWEIIMFEWAVIRRGKDVCYLEMPHRLFYEFTISSFATLMSVRDTVDSFPTGSPEHRKATYDVKLAMNNVAIYAALSLEAYLNYYSERYQIHLSKKEEYYPTAKKWKLVLKRKLNKTIDDVTIDKIRSIFKLRSSLVHSKPELGKFFVERPPEQMSPQGRLELTELGELIITVNEIFLSTFKLDPDEFEFYHKNEQWLRVLQKVS